MAAARRAAPRKRSSTRRESAAVKRTVPAGAAANDERAQVIAAAGAVKRALVSREFLDQCRRDPAVFCQYVLKDEETGGPIRLAPHHEDWHDLLTANDRAVIWSATDLGKTSQISIGRVLFEIGKNPRIRILIVCESKGLGQKIIESIKAYITTSEEYARVFPHVRRGSLWTKSQITVARPGKAKDPTVQAVGFRGRILGARVDLIVIDDYLSADNTYSQHHREATHRWLKSTIEGRKSLTRPRLWFIGNAWHKRDSMHLYSKELGCASRAYPVLLPDGSSRWPERWPLERYRAEVINRGSIEARRSLDCEAADDNTQWFPIKDIWPALVLGDGLGFLFGLGHVPNGSTTITAIDLGVKESDAADDTAIVSIIVDPKGRRRILWAEAGKWRGSDIIAKAVDHHRRYHSIVWVETNGAQDYLRQFMTEQNRDVPVRSFVTTGRNRMHPTFGIQALAARMAAGSWAIPNKYGSKVDPVHDGLTAVRMNPAIAKLVSQMLEFSPDAHTGDLLQATWIADSAARFTRIVEVGAKPQGT